jgi:hypothetical protein
MTNTDVEYFVGTKMDNDLVFPQANLSSSRILANFDDKKYSYLNNIPQKDFNTAKKIYYNSSPDLNRSTLYARRNSNFSLISNLCYSGMTSRFSPRRNLDIFLSTKLTPLVNLNSNILYIYNFDDTQNTFFTNEEYLNFKKTLSVFLKDTIVDEKLFIKNENFHSFFKNLPQKKYDLIILINCYSHIAKNNFIDFFHNFSAFNSNFLFLSETTIDNSTLSLFFDYFLNFKSYKHVSSTGYFHDVADDFIDNSVLYIS